MFWRLFIWAVALMSLPGRILTALQRERTLGMQLHEKEIELENLVWNRKELEDRLQMAIKERRLMEIMLAELEDEHDQAIIKIESLEDELQDVKRESLRLKEAHGKGLSNLKSCEDSDKDENKIVPDKYEIPYGIPSWKSGYDGSGLLLQELFMHKDVWDDKTKTKMDLPDFMMTGITPGGPINPFMHSRNFDVSEILYEKREVALSQTLFSAVLSLLVGMIVWEAEDPCMPLVVALFIVVAISMKSVVQFFSTIKIKPAADAVALLSFNCFILGTLTYPTLPRVARMLSLWALIIAEKTVRWLGFSL